ncbi:HGxxPAAW family protein [Acrocarpospora catenulata]|uniref:HGxxPAAW family protein n=1 Tax=Acrocarpospora catenulata TaxID=2836182 RepID=UPI001BD9138C|nr:HGxxPAAW family protein [Acrocarpospora catenulata]
MADTTHQSHAGSPTSWLAVSVILIGFIVGGVALTGLGGGVNWLMFWIGAGISAVGGLLALVFDIFSDVIVDAPRVLAAKEHHSPVEHKDVTQRALEA